MIVSGARRLLILLGVLVGGTGAISALLGLLTGHGLGRSVSLGFYAVGALSTVIGFAFGTRGAFGGTRRAASKSDEVRATLGTSGLFIAIGLIMLTLGIVADPRARLI